ncbi:MAG: hypothetical protein POELPBGB_00877 [Bacteroidia bacterium]|nr:hypothetical protein [Bacteroidia bacterium]
MGLSIYYSGRFNPKASLIEMIDEVKDITETEGWKYHVFEKEFKAKALGKKTFDEDVYGILFSPPGSEPVTLCFLSNGKLCNPFIYDYWLKNKKSEEGFLIEGSFTKTQYAGVTVHIKVINLLRYVSGKYFSEFNVNDESKFWETGDEKMARKTFKEWDAMIDGFADALENLEPKKGETIEDAILRVAKKVQKRRKN